MDPKMLNVHTLATIRMPAVKITRLLTNESVEARAEIIRAEEADVAPAERTTIPSMRAVRMTRNFKPIPRED
jgi:hypothetical protein